MSMATHLFSWVLTKRNCTERKAKIWLQRQQQQLLVTAAAALQQVKKKDKEEQISLQDTINQPWNIS
jgi:PIN domain nuclease of toxin-antitoxin system